MTRSWGLAARRIAQTRRFHNGAGILAGLAAGVTPWGPAELTFQTRDGLVVVCPNVPGARVPVYEIFAEDAYRLATLVPKLPRECVVLDIGAQIGCFSLAVAARHRGARIHAYEASPTSATWAARNVTANALDDRVVVHAEALAGTAGTIRLADNHGASALNGSLVSGSGTMVEVPSITFADAVRRIGGHVDLVKIDTEGAEYDIVLATPPEAWTSVSQVVAEYHDVPRHSAAELVAYWRECGLVVVADAPSGARHGTLWLEREG